MASDKSKGYVRDLITETGRCAFPHLASPNSVGNYPSHKYELNFLFSKNDKKTLELLLTAAKKAMAEKWPECGGDGKIVIKDGDEKANLDGYPGNFFIVPKSKNKPVIVGPDRKPLPEGQSVKGGDHVRVNVTAGAFKQNLDKEVYEALKAAGKKVFMSKDKDEAGKDKIVYWRPSCTFYLEMVQKVKDGEAFGGGKANPDLFPEEEPEAGAASVANKASLFD